MSSSTPTASTSPFAELRTRLHDLIYGYGLFDTLDRDHFYPTLDAALETISHEEE